MMVLQGIQELLIYHGTSTIQSYHVAKWNSQPTLNLHWSMLSYTLQLKNCIIWLVI